MQLAADELGLQRHPVDPHELLGGGGPGRQDHVARRRVGDVQPVPRAVDQHLGEEEQLWDEFLKVRERFLTFSYWFSSYEGK